MRASRSSTAASTSALVGSAVRKTHHFVAPKISWGSDHFSRNSPCMGVVSSRPHRVTSNVQTGPPQDRSGPLDVGPGVDQEHPRSRSGFKHTLGTPKRQRAGCVSVQQATITADAASRQALTISNVGHDKFNHWRVKNGPTEGRIAILCVGGHLTANLRCGRASPRVARQLPQTIEESRKLAIAQTESLSPREDVGSGVGNHT